MGRKRLIVLALVAAAVVAGSGYVYGVITAQRLKRALAGRIELGGLAVEPGEVATSIGYFSAGARLKDGRITFDGGVVLVPASTLTLEKGALVGTAETARLRLDGLPELDTRFERISYRLTDPAATPGGGRVEARVTAGAARAESDTVRLAAKDLSLTADRKDHERWDSLAMTLADLGAVSKRTAGPSLGAAKVSWMERYVTRGDRRLGVGIETGADGLRLEAVDPRGGRVSLGKLALKADLEIDGDRRTTLLATLREVAGAPDPVRAYTRRFNPVVPVSSGLVNEVTAIWGAATMKVAETAFEYAERPKGAVVEKSGTFRLARLEASGDGTLVTLAEAKAVSESTTSPTHERALLAQFEPGATIAPGPELLGALIDYVMTANGKGQLTFRDLLVRETPGGEPLTFPDGGMDLELGFRDGVGSLTLNPRLTVTTLKALEGRVPVSLPLDRVGANLKLFVRNVNLGEVRRLVSGTPSSGGDWTRLANESLRTLVASKPGVGAECVLDADGGLGLAVKTSLDLDRPRPPGFRVERYAAAGGAGITQALLGVGTFRLRVDVSRYRRLVDLLEVALGRGAGEAWLAQTQEFFTRSGEDLVADLTVRGGRAELNGKPSPLAESLLGRRPSR
jgi:hypothetical protein